MKLYSNDMAEKKPVKKYIARKFVPKAYYKVFDWENYVPGQEFEPGSDLPVIQKNPEAELLSPEERRNLNKSLNSELVKQKSERIAESPAVQRDFNKRESKEPETVQGEIKEIKPENTSEKKIENKAEKKEIKKSAEIVSGKVKPFNSIGAKLITIISSLMAMSLILITILVSYFVSADTRVNAEDNNLTINSRTSLDTESRFTSVISNAGMFIDLLEGSGENLVEQKKNAAMFFERNNDMAAIVLPDSDRIFCNTQFFNLHELDSGIVENLVFAEEENLNSAQNGQVILENVSALFGTPVIAMYFPLYSSAKDNVVLVVYSVDALAESFSSGSINQSFLVNGKGEVLIHSDLDLMMNGEDLSRNPIVNEMRQSSVNNRQMTYYDNNEIYIGAFRKLNVGDGAVITIVKESVILEAVKSTTRRNIYLTFAILALSILIIYFFAKTITKPLRKLTDITNEINKGNFDTDMLNDLSENRKDEIGVLENSTKNEQNILTTFTKLTNKGVTKAIIRKEIDFDPHLKDITIFFSDIRGFTAISDGFKNRFGEKSAGEIIGFLNDYMSRMVNCITITGGNVDKFEGDAIMACWGVLRDDSLAFETMDESNPEYERLKKIHDEHVVKDALSAIQATIAMRYSLAKYNKDAEAFTKLHQNEAMAKYKPHIRIGSGLNSGRATVGFMGSEDKMEFTSIGDAVNLASRTEASNKPCGTDILITEDTYNLLKEKYIRCEENNFTISEENSACEVIVEVIPVTFEVKGKGKQHFYGVVNMPQFNIEEFFKKGDADFQIDEDCANVIGPKGPKTLHEVRTLLGIPEPDFGGVNLDQEENKIQIKAD